MVVVVARVEAKLARLGLGSGQPILELGLDDHAKPFGGCGAAASVRCEEQQSGQQEVLLRVLSDAQLATGRQVMCTGRSHEGPPLITLAIRMFLGVTRASDTTSAAAEHRQ